MDALSTKAIVAALLAVLCSAALAAPTQSPTRSPTAQSPTRANSPATTSAGAPRQVMLAWVNGNGNPDFIASIDADPASSTYGSELSRTFLPSGIATVSRTGNEPHHLGLTSTMASQRPVLALGGLLSFLQGKDDMFLFDASDPLHPEFLSSGHVDGYGCIDEFKAYGAGFLVTAMCSSAAGAPGAVLSVDVNAQTFTTFTAPDGVPGDSNPHGFDVYTPRGKPDPTRAYLIAGDYVLPSSLLSSPVFRDTLQMYDMTGRHIATYSVPGSGGFMDVKFVPGSSFAASGGSLNNFIYFMSPTQPPVPAFDLSLIDGGTRSISAGIMRFTANGRFLVMTYAMRYVVTFAVNSAIAWAPPKLTLVQSYDFCTDPAVVCGDLENGLPGSHYVQFNPNESKFFVANYFLRFGVAEFTGSQSLHGFDFDKSTGRFTRDDRFVVQYADQNASPHSFGFVALDD